MHLNDDFFLHTLQRSLLYLLVVSAASILTSSWNPINENRMKNFSYTFRWVLTIKRVKNGLFWYEGEHSDKFVFSDLEFTRKGLKMNTNNHSF